MDMLRHALNGVKKIEFTKRTLFLALGVVMMLATSGLIVWLATFLADRMNTALTADPNVTPRVQFDIAGFEKLQLTK